MIVCVFFATDGSEEGQQKTQSDRDSEVSLDKAEKKKRLRSCAWKRELNMLETFNNDLMKTTTTSQSNVITMAHRVERTIYKI